MIRSTLSTLCGGILLMITPAHAQSATPADAAALLKQAIAAATQLESVSYEAESHSEGELTRINPTTTGRVVAKRGGDGQPPLLCVTGSSLPANALEPADFTFAVDGERLYHIDARGRTCTTGKIKDLGISLAHPLFPAAYLDAALLREALTASSPSYEGGQTVNGVDCHVLTVRFRDVPERDSRLFFGKDDLLLRRIERAAAFRPGPGLPGLTGMTIFSVKNLTTSPKIDDSIFRPSCPDGFQSRELTPRNGGSRGGGLLPVGSDAPDWELKDGEGRTVSLKSLRGKVVVLDFWATWCGPCKMAMPSLQKLHDRFKDKPVAVFGVNCMERSKTADPRGYIKQQGYTYGQLYDGNAVASAYKVSGIPCFYVIGPDGKILEAHAGFSPQLMEQTIAVIEKALEESRAAAATPSQPRSGQAQPATAPTKP